MMLLFDMRDAARNVVAFVEGKSLDEYRADVYFRSAVERQLYIVGEAAHQVSQLSPVMGQQISDLRPIIRLRHILAHGYAYVDNDTLWSIAQEHVPVLLGELDQLLSSAHDERDRPLGQSA